MTAPLTWPRVLAWRLERQLLGARGRVDAPSVASRLCGIQAQVASAAEIAIGARQAAPVPGDVGRALWVDRSLVKCWAMRGTLHLLDAREHSRYASTLSTLRYWEKGAWPRYHGVTADDVESIREAAHSALGDGEALTRQELADRLIDRLDRPVLAEKLGSGWGELLKPLSFMGEICHGPPQGGRVTFVRPDLWLGSTAPEDPEEAGPALVRSFLSAHGPATVDDFGRWWARARPSAVRPWFQALGDELAEVEVEGGPPAMVALAGDIDSLRDVQPSASVRLVPNFDQFLLAAARDLLVLPEHKGKVFRTAGWISPAVLVGGRVAGVWRLEKDREQSPARLRVELFEAVDDDALAVEADHLARIVGAEAGALRPRIGG